MTASAVLDRVRALGIEVAADGEKLRYAAPVGRLTPELRQELVAHKPAIIALLRTGGGGRDAGDWQAFFNERAGIMEYDGGVPRETAEARAFEACIVEWLDLTAEPSPAGRCRACGGADNADDLTPFLARGGHVWLHLRCWQTWLARRTADATAALEAFGIVRPGNRQVR